MRVGFMHTVGFLVDRFRELMRQAHPQVACFHVLNESLLQDLVRDGPTPFVIRRVVDQVLLIVDAGADLVVSTCSSTSPAIDAARLLASAPILKIDDPMAVQAVRLGPKIGIVCTARSTVGPSESLIRQHAAEQGREVSIETTLEETAYAALHAGDRARHDALVREAAHRLAGHSDVVVLAQASLAHLRDGLADEIGRPILSSPPLLMAEIGRRVASERGAL